MSTMKFWLVKAEKYDYDEYDAFLVRATNTEEAYTIVISQPGTANFYRENVTITEVPLEGPPEIIIDSFNAG